LFLFILLNKVNCQTIYNNGQNIFISNNTDFFVNGDFSNYSGQTENSGIVTITGNFNNNDTFNSDGIINLYGNFTNQSIFYQSAGNLNLKGNNQNISGTSSIYFYNLNIEGSGIKSLNQNVIINNSLNLNALELSINNNFVKIENAGNLSILRTTGFISNGLNGKLIRKTNSNQQYLFPTGSSVGNARYRPVELAPSGSDLNYFSASFYNYNASNDGYNTNSIDTNICKVNNLYFHKIMCDSGNTAAELKIYFDTLSDGFYSDLTNWQTNKWVKVPNASATYSNLLSSIQINNFNFSGSGIFSLANSFQPVHIIGNDSACIGETITLSTNSGYNSYLWSNGSLMQTINVNSSGLYIVTVTQNTCQFSDSINVSFTPIPIANAGTDQTICVGTSAQLSASGGNSYLWLTTNGLSEIDIPNPIANPANTLNYIVEVSNGYCKSYDTVTIFVNNLPFVFAGYDTIIYENIDYQLNAVAPSYLSVSWSPSIGLSNANILNPIVNINSQSAYYVTIIDNNGCSNSDTIIISTKPEPVYSLIIHNTFTPNNDGKNDAWIIENISHFSNNHLYIYNRNGHLVYEKINYNNEWDGKYYGNNLPEATYYYILNVENFPVYKGDVTIIR